MAKFGWMFGLVGCCALMVFPADAPAQQHLTAQSAADGSGSMAQVAAAGGWNTLFTLVNTGASAANAQLSFFDDSGDPLSLPVTFPQVLAGAFTGIAPTPDLTRTINPGASLLVQSTGDVNANSITGWAKLTAAAGVQGFGIFKFPELKWEAVVPLETRTATSYILAFDNTGSLATGVAISLTAGSGDIQVTLRNENGASIGTDTISLPSQGHTSFMLGDQYPATAGKRGTIQFDAPSGGQISVLGLRSNGGALTTLPVLTNGASGGGSIAHVTFNNGFTSSYYLVNTGVTAAQFTLTFSAEDGSALNVPMLLPQSNTSVTAATLTRALDPGAMLEVDTVGQDTLPAISGSATVTSTGSVGGFEIFRWTTFGQEASVPLETRTPSGFVLAFDNKGGLTTGVALSVVSAASVSIPVKIKDDAGNVLQSASISLAGHGHVSFLLPLSFPATADQRGIVEFTVPSGSKIAVIGLRAKSDGTLTTIPLIAE